MSNSAILGISFCEIRGRYAANTRANPLHLHPVWQWDYVDEGRARIEFVGRVIECRKGESILIPPNYIHRIGFSLETIYSSFKFTWLGATMLASLSASSPNSPRELEPRLFAKKQVPTPLRDGLWHAARFTDKRHLTDASCYLHLLLGELLSPTASAPPPDAPLDEQVRWLLEERRYGSLSVVELARECRMSRSYFIRQFRRLHQETPARYVMRLRLERAGELIESADMNLTQIAHTLGFPDLYTFSKAFKKERGISPKDWRGKLGAVKK